MDGDPQQLHDCHDIDIYNTLNCLQMFSSMKPHIKYGGPYDTILLAKVKFRKFIFIGFGVEHIVSFNVRGSLKSISNR